MNRTAFAFAVAIASAFIASSASSADDLINNYPGSYAYNIWVGVNVGNQTMGGAATHNSVVGRNSLSQLTTGHSNSVFGADAMGSNTTGVNNSAVGRSALGSNTSGVNNSALGLSALYRNTMGGHNSAVGVQSLYRNTTGSHNTAVGRDAMFSNTEGAWNTGIGVDAIPGNETGNGNTAVGGEAGYTQDWHNQNVTGDHNVWIGYQAGPKTPAQVSNSIGIGYRAQNDKSNQVVIGNEDTTETVLFGTVRVEELCVGATCINETQLQQLLALIE